MFCSVIALCCYFNYLSVSNFVLVNLSDCTFDNYAEIDVIWAKPSINEEIHIIIIIIIISFHYHNC